MTNMRKHSTSVMLIFLPLALSLTGCASRCASEAPSLAVQPVRPPQIRAELMTPESATYSRNAELQLSAWRAKLTGSP